jgi:hypothetical protein
MTERHEPAAVETPRRQDDGTETVEAYDVDGGVVLHDAEDPFAWVEASLAVDLSEQT